MSHAIAHPLQPGLMNVAEFIEWTSHNDGKWQLVDGVPHAMNPGSRTHGTLQGELARQLGNSLEAVRPDCVVILEPGIIPRLNAEQNYRVPDIIVTCSTYVEECWAVDAPILIVEVLSGSNRAQTWMNIWAFTTIPSVQDIVVLHTDAIRASILTRLADGNWPTAPTILETDAILQVASLAFATPLAGLYRNTRLAPG